LDFVFVAGTTQGIGCYSIDPVDGSLTIEDQKDISSGQHLDVWSDGTYIYAAVAFAGGSLDVYSVDGGGTLTLEDSYPGSYYGVHGDGNFIYACSGNSNYLRVFTVDGAGTLTFKDSDYISGTYQKLWADGNGLVFVAAGSTGIISYSVHPTTGVLTHVDTNKPASLGNANDIWGDGNGLLYTSNSSGGVGLHTFTYDATGTMTFLDSYDSETVVAYGIQKQDVAPGTEYILLGSDSSAAYDRNGLVVFKVQKISP